MLAVHHDLLQRLEEPHRSLRIREPRHPESFLEPGWIGLGEKVFQLAVVVPDELPQSRHRAEFRQRLRFLRRSLPDVEEGPLDRMEMMKPLSDGLILQRVHLFCERAPVNRVGPFLMCEEIAELLEHTGIIWPDRGWP